MKSKTTCAQHVIVWTTVFVAISLLATAFVVYKVKLQILPYLEAITPSLNIVKCELKTKSREVYQYGQYWVLRNYVMANKNETFCGDVTITMQGQYKDILNLQNFYIHGYLDSFMSFAVHIPNEQYLNQTLRAISYMRNCFQASNKLSNLHPVREFVSFHLYFNPHTTNLRYLPQNPTEDIANNDNCQEPNTPLLLTDLPDSDIDEEERAGIVGRNIAQLEATTKFVLNTDADTYVTGNFTEMFTGELTYFPMLPQHIIDKLIFRLPTLLISNLKAKDLLSLINPHASRQFLKQRSSQYLQSNLEPLDLVEYITHPFQNTPFLSMHETLSALHQTLSYFITYRERTPLLAERAGFYYMKSEKLRLLQLGIQNYTFTPMAGNFVLHNVTEDNVFIRKNYLDEVGAVIFEEYLRMFAVVF